MEKLNEYLKTLLSTCSYELHLEPNETPYLVDDNGRTDVSSSPLLGTQISTIIFPLIPDEAKRDLPNKAEIEFVHNHSLGNFNFNVKKSPSGFNVTIYPMLSDPSVNGGAAPEMPAEDETAPAGADEPKRDLSNASTEIAEKLASLTEKLKGQKDQKQDEEPAAPADNSPVDPYEEFREDPAAESAPENQSATDENAEPGDMDAQQPVIDYSNIEIEGTSYQVETAGEEFPTVETVAIDDAGSSAAADVQDFSLPATPPVASEPESGTIISPVEYLEAHMQKQEEADQKQKEAASVAASVDPQARSRMDDLFRKMADEGASDMHLCVSMPPMIRQDGRIRKLKCKEGFLLPETIRDLLNSIMPEKNREEFARRNDTDFAYEIEGLARFRANIFRDRKGMGGVFRIIPSKIMTAEDLGLSEAIMDLCNLSKGLVVVTGPTGSGKSTTLCALIDHINDNREEHIITIEDPIEFVHDNKKCLVNQREVGNHTGSFKDALRAALREDPDILLVGEMRDLETISIAIETAETGHLVFGTLHTTTAASTVDRIIDQFPADRQQQVRVMLSESLRGVIAQTLLPKKGGGRVAALEVLIVTPGISNLIREGKTFQIASAMQTGKNKGMVLLNDALFDLVEKGLVEPRDAYIKAVDKPGFEALLQKNGLTI